MGRALTVRAASVTMALVATGFAACGTHPGSALGESIGTTSQAISSPTWYGDTLPLKTLALTFDDGPGGNFVPPYVSTAGEISRYLRTQGIRAVFFENGARIKPTSLPNPNGISVTTDADGNPDASTILAQILADGHLVANHTVTHRDMPTVAALSDGPSEVLQELTETDADLTGFFPSGRYLFRAPYGSWDDDDWADLSATPMNKYLGPIKWDAGGISTQYPGYAADWACWQGQIYTDASGGTELADVNPGYPGYLTTAQCCEQYLTEIHNLTTGGIVLMHDPYYWDQGNTIEMVETCLVPTLKAEGYSFVRVDEIPIYAAALPPCDPSCATCLGVGPSFCESCTGKTFLDVGAITGVGTCTACSTCAAGTYESAACNPTADTVCTACDASCATCTGAGPSACASCASGTYLTTDATCAPCGACAPGQYETAACTPTSAPVCTACAPGTFAPDGGAQACASCAAGSAAPDAGATACAPCAVGTSADPGQNACSACAVGDVSGMGATTCTSCTAGTFAPPDAGTCAPCAGGTSAPAGSAACTACAPGTAAKSGDLICRECNPGTFALSAGASECTPCAVGHFTPQSGATACGPCAAGSFAATPGADSCVACAAGTFTASPGATACTACGSCDDGDACTVDSCSPAAGCVHTATPGCSVPSDASIGDASAVDATAVEDAGLADASAPRPDAMVVVRESPPAADAVGASSGCNTSGSSPGTPVAPLAFAALGLAWVRRARRS